MQYQSIGKQGKNEKNIKKRKKQEDEKKHGHHLKLKKKKAKIKKQVPHNTAVGGFAGVAKFFFTAALVGDFVTNKVDLVD